MIQLEGTSKRFREIEALAPVDLEIRRGEWMGIFGRNGSGKTSLLRILVGLSQPSTGRVLLEGKPPQPEDWRTFRSQLGFMPERVVFHENLTAEKTLRYFARLRGVDRNEVMPALESVGLGDAAKRRVGGYSKGMLQRLNLAQALLGTPRLLFLDEPFSGLDPGGVGLFLDLLKSVENRTVVFSSHRVHRLYGKVDRICVLSAGHVKALGTEADLCHRLELPVRVILQPLPGANGKLEADLGRLALGSVGNEDGKVVARVPQVNKTAFLAELKAFDDLIQYLRIEEPSIEEILLETD